MSSAKTMCMCVCVWVHALPPSHSFPLCLGWGTDRNQTSGRELGRGHAGRQDWHLSHSLCGGNQTRVTLRPTEAQTTHHIITEETVTLPCCCKKQQYSILYWFECKKYQQKTFSLLFFFFLVASLHNRNHLYLWAETRTLSLSRG